MHSECERVYFLFAFLQWPRKYTLLMFLGLEEEIEMLKAQISRLVNTGLFSGQSRSVGALLSTKAKSKESFSNDKTIMNKEELAIEDSQVNILCIGVITSLSEDPFL